MRPSSRTEILDAALRVVDAVDGADITYESVARQAGLTKAGLMYHFPSKDALMAGIIGHVIDRWQTELCEVLGIPPEESTLAQRVQAFVRFAGSGEATQGEFAVFAEAVRRPQLSGPWLAWLRSWFAFGEGADSAPLLLVWLAAHGMWITEATDMLSVTPAQRAAVLGKLTELIEETSV